MLLFNRFIGWATFFSRARAHVYKCTSACLAAFLFLSVGIASAADPAFVRDSRGIIQGLVLNGRQEQATRNILKILSRCIHMKAHPSAMSLVGSENSTLSVLTQARTGVFVLEAILSKNSFKTLDTELAGPYKNFPVSMPITPMALPAPRHAFALTIAAPLADQGSVVLNSGDVIRVKTDGQLYAFPFPAMKIPAGGMLRVYLGTDDTLYYDAGLTHPLHEGRCKKPTK